MMRRRKRQAIYFFLSLLAAAFFLVPRTFLARFFRSFLSLRPALSTLEASPLRINRYLGSKFMPSLES